MDFFETFKAPKRPRFKFGEPLEKIYEDGSLHAGIKDLFLKAYLTAKKDDLIDDDRSEQDVLLALKSGTKGQGSLSQRLALKTRLEKGEWLIPAQTTKGAPLWLLRHFLGRLPEPLLKGTQWKALGRACGEASGFMQQELLERIAASTRELNQYESEILALLTLLIRKFYRTDKQVDDDDEVLDALSQYFIASITTRPFRPGLYTQIDKECQPLLVFISKHWDSIFQEIPECSVSNSTLDCDRLDESYQYFQDESSLDDSSKKPIGFEQFVQDDNNEQLKEGTDNEIIESVCLRNGNAVIGGLGMIKLFSELHMRNFEKYCLQKNTRAALTRDDEKVADGKENVSSRFKLSEFLKSTPEPLDNSVAAASGEEDENTSDDTEKHEFYSVPNTDDSQ